MLPVVPWLFALLAFGPGAPPVPFTVAPLLNVFPVADDGVPPVAEPGELPVALLAAPPAVLPLAPAPAARAGTGNSNAMRSSLDDREDDMDNPFH